MIQDLTPIYLKLSEKICDNILWGDYASNQRIPSIREMAASHEVNPNTVMKAFEHLQQNEIIYNRRGLGYFVSEDAMSLIKKARQKHFKEEILPNMFKQMSQLGIEIEDIISEFENYKTEER